MENRKERNILSFFNEVCFREYIAAGACNAPCLEMCVRLQQELATLLV